MRDGRRRGHARATRSFLGYVVSDDGQAKLTELGYVPISGDLLAKVRSAVSSLAA